MAGFFVRNWKWLAAIMGYTVARELIQRRQFIELQDKVVLISGGSRGLGLLIAQEFAYAGCKLVICSREEDELARAHEQLSAQGASVLTVPCDVTDQRQVQQMVAQAIARFDRIDILVNNAGIISAGALQTLTRSDFEQSMDIMFWGAYNTIMAVLPQMQERKSGRIVNITSVGGKVAVPHLLAYSSAKFALVGFSEGLHTELVKDGIIVTTVAPGLMRTGSTVNTTMKGNEHKTEYTLFTLLDTLPITSIDATRAARQIVNATKRGDTELIISIQAQLLSRLHGFLPGLTTDLLTLSNLLLPTSWSQGTQHYTGKESETPVTRSPLTALGQKATRANNELGTTQ